MAQKQNDPNQDKTEQNLKPLMPEGARKAVRIIDITADDDPEAMTKAVKSAVDKKIQRIKALQQK